MLTLELVTLDGIKLAEDVYEVLIPTPEGQIAVFPNHATLVSLVEAGIISVRKRESDKDDKLEHYATQGGVVEINDKRVRILVDDAHDSDSVVLKEAEEALELAHKQAAQADDIASLESALKSINTNRARIKVAGMKRRKQHY